MAIDYTKALSQLRLLISDVNELAYTITDDHVGGYLTMHGLTSTTVVTPADLPALKRAAADALDAIATSEALVSKVIRTQDLQTDGPKTAAALRAHAQALRAQATEAEADDDGGTFEVAEFTPWPTVL